MGYRHGLRFMFVLATAVTAGACGGDDGEPAPAALPATASASAVHTVAAQVAPDPRKVVFTASLTVRVDDSLAAAAQAKSLVREAGGLVFAQQDGAVGDHGTVLTLKVPPDRFDDVVDDLAALGRTLQRELAAEDVTEKVVDLEGRLRSAQASAERLRALLSKAASTTDLVGIENELTKREAEIETLQGRMRLVEASAAMATIKLRLTERGGLEVAKDIPGFGRSLRTGGVALTNAGLVLLSGVGFSLPFVPFAALGWVVVSRRRGRRGGAGR